MNIWKATAPQALLLLALTACARTTMTSVPAPEAISRAYRNVLIVGDFADLGLRQELESRFAASESRVTTRFITSTSIFFPGRQYSQEEIAKTLQSYEISGTLVISPGSTGSSTGYVPPTYTSGCTLATSSGCQQVTTKASGGYSYSKPWAEFTAQLYDVRSAQVVWYATATTGGNAYASWTTLIRSMADKTLERLVSDGVVGPRR